MRKSVLVIAAVVLVVTISVTLASYALGQKTVPGFREDCIGYNPERLEVIDEGERGWLLTDDGGRHRMLGLDDRDDAEAALALAKRHRAMCFIGRNNRRPNRGAYIVQYWK